MRNRAIILVAALLAAMPRQPARAQRLGTIEFPNSGSPAAQPSFIRGMLLLHSFEYGDAAIAFREAQNADPGFALAYAGEALTYSHPVWNQLDSVAARAVLSKLGATPAERRAKARMPREQMYMDAVEALYGAGSKPRRDTLFAAAMERIVAAHPADDEARVFLAVALLGLNQSEREEVAYMRAGAIAEEVLRRKPDHPGAAHFVIHAFDDPAHAPLGLWAARAYSKIAPQAPHAQHMTTHIFVAMGMWDDVVSQNIIASGADHMKWRAGHYTVWLGYGYLQQGRYADAHDHLALMKAHAVTPLLARELPSLIQMRATYLIGTERWDDPVATWTFPPAPLPLPRAIDAFTAAYVALKRGDRTTAERMAAAVAAEEAGGRAALIHVLSMEIQAALAAARGQADSAIVLIREAARLDDATPVEFGPPVIPKPPHELAGEILLAAGRAAEAQQEFTRALELMPGRARSLIGLARAATRTGDQAVAARAAADLTRNWHSADGNLVERSEMTRIARPR
jgi:tetratricopeptide (TPR) repeat protein